MTHCISCNSILDDYEIDICNDCIVDNLSSDEYNHTVNEIEKDCKENS